MTARPTPTPMPAAAPAERPLWEDEDDEVSEAEGADDVLAPSASSVGSEDGEDVAVVVTSSVVALGI